MALASIIPGWKIVSTTVGILVVAFIGWLLIDHFIIGPRDLVPMKRSALKAAADDLVHNLEKHYDNSGNYGTARKIKIALADVHNDTSNKEAFDVLKSRLGASTRFEVDGSALEMVKDRAAAWVGRGKPPAAAEELLRNKGELDAALLASLSMRENSMEMKAGLEAHLYERVPPDEGRPEAFLVKDIEGLGLIDPATGDAPITNATGMTFWQSFWWMTWRLVVSLAGLFAIPFLFLPVTDWVISRGSNLVGYSYLGLIVLAGLVPWFVLFVLDKNGGSASAWTLGVALACVGAAWTYRMHEAWSERI
jgi:hypothetical protein